MSRPTRGWAVEFRSRAGFVAYASRRSAELGAPVAAETTPAYVAVWATRAEAWAYLERNDLDPKEPIPIGTGFMFPAVVPLDLADLEPRPEWLCGAMFEVNGPAWKPQTIMEAKAELDAVMESMCKEAVAAWSAGEPPPPRPKRPPKPAPTTKQAAFDFGD